ncbi:MAG TPA: DUF3617 domain-containing protein [Rhizomicrobium sp.]|jgi:hypothetical protein|nr:DUF3617 domain-containing protein [Rhizomicrobium sp.]
MKHLTVITAAALMLAPATAIAVPHGKAGLWTITTTMKMANMPEMPPQVLEMMKKRGMPGMGQPMTSQMCMTLDDVNADPNARMQAQHQVNCTPHIVSQTANSAITEIVCHGNMEGTGRSQISWHGDSHYEGTYSFNGTMHGRPNAMSSRYTGDWVKADCGAVKPYTARPNQH